MAAQLIDGKAIAQDVRAQVARDVAAWVAQGHEPPGLATVLVGDDPASAVYVGNKQKASAEVGIAGFDHRLAQDASHEEVDALLRELAADPRVSGILLQLPTPPQVDGRGAGRADPGGQGRRRPHAACPAGCSPRAARACARARPSGVMEMLRRHDVALEGAEAVVVGRSDLVGRPLSALLLAANATVTVCHSRTRDLADGLPPRRRARRRGRAPADDPGRLGQAGRDGDRRRDQPHRRRARRRRRLRRRPPSAPG